MPHGDRDLSLEERIKRHTRWENGCRIWDMLTNTGYGRISVEGRRWLIHRLVWTMAHGELPKGWHVHHLCGTLACCNLDHLQAVSAGAHQNEHHVLPETCSKGHSWSMYERWTKRGTRYCNECARLKNKRLRAAHPERYAAYHRRYYEANTEEVKAKARTHRAAKKSAT